MVSWANKQFQTAQLTQISSLQQTKIAVGKSVSQK